MQRLTRSLVISLGLIISSALLAACEQEAISPPGPQPSLSGLRQFQDCSEFSSWLEAGFSRPDEASAPLDSPVTTAEEGDSANAAEDGAADTAAGSQEAAAQVEEADIIKRAGNRLYVLNQSSGLLIYDVTKPAAPVRLAQYKLSVNPKELYVDGFKVAIIGSAGYGDQSVVRWLNSTNPAAIQVIKEWSFRGSYSDSRKIGDSLYLALQTYIRSRDAETYIEERSDCSRVYAPRALDEDSFYSVTAWQLIGINLDQPNTAPNQASVIGGDRSQLQASPSRIYLSNHTYKRDETEIYVFELSTASSALAPRAHGTVPGVIVNQFSLDEYAGHFRIATTTNRRTFGAADNRNYITIFKVDSSGLKQTGQIKSIAPGESISAVRFVGDKGFVTTYVTKDPLFTLDLSNPSNPKVIGELDVPGFPQHIHVWDNYVISVGSESEWWGSVILSLFDISDFANPKLIEQITVEDSYGSEAQNDHRAFSFFEARSQLALPVSTSGYISSELFLYDVNPNTGFELRGRISHQDLLDANESYAPAMRRSLEIGATLYSISEGGLKATSFSDTDIEYFGEMFPDYESYGYYGGPYID